MTSAGSGGLSLLMSRMASRQLFGLAFFMGLRTATLGLRFALSFYIVSFLGLEAAGVFGLIVGAVGIVPAGLGWGLNYFLSREVVGMKPAEAAPLIVQRLIVTLASLAAATLIYVAVLPLLPDAMHGAAVLMLALLWLETIGLDTYMPLIGLDLSGQANILVFIRSAAWVPVAIGLGVLNPSFRTLDLVLLLWIAGHVCALVIMIALAVRWPLSRALDGQPSIDWPASRFSRAWPIYLSDISLVGLVYIDRFIVNGMIGIAATGIYSFYWSITNALQTLVSTAIVQPAIPRMIRAMRGEGEHDVRMELRRQMLKTAGIAILLALGIFAATEFVIWISPPGRFPRAEMLLTLLLLASVVRVCAELLNLGITSAGHDHVYAGTNIAGIVLSLIVSPLLLAVTGLVGAGLSALIVAIILLLVRAAYIRKVILPKVGG